MIVPLDDESVFDALPVVHSMGMMLFDPIWSEKAHLSNRCELLYITSGTANLEMGGERHTAGPGEMLLIPSDTVHRDVFDLGAGLEVFLIFFAWPGEDAFFKRVSYTPLQRITGHRKGEITHLLDQLRRDPIGETDADHLLVRARLLTLLTLLLRATQLATDGSGGERTARGGQRRHQLMQQTKQYLNAHYTQPVSLDDIARALDVSPFYLSHVFSEENDFSLFAYLTTLRMERARELLRRGMMKVADVAEAVGYENGNYFSKVFRKYFGCSPSSLQGK